MDGRAAIIVPRREDTSAREALWEHVSARLDAAGWVYVTAPGPTSGKFNRAAALNEAAERATQADVLVVMDADTIVGDQQIASAVAIARHTGVVTFAFGRYAALDKGGTERVLQGYDGDWEPFVAYEFHNTASSCLAIRRDLWDTVGGFDPGFVGWGYEDVAASLAFQAVGGGMHRVAGTAWHLWHPPSPVAGNEQHPEYRRNQARCEPYRAAADDRDAMLAVLRSYGRVA